MRSPEIDNDGTSILETIPELFRGVKQIEYAISYLHANDVFHRLEILRTNTENLSVEQYNYLDWIISENQQKTALAALHDALSGITMI